MYGELKFSNLIWCQFEREREREFGRIGDWILKVYNLSCGRLAYKN